VVTRLVRLELASLFFVVMAENAVGDGLNDIEFVEARMRNCGVSHFLRLRWLELIEAMVYLLDRREQGG